jgi:hypothetical protein
MSILPTQTYCFKENYNSTKSSHPDGRPKATDFDQIVIRIPVPSLHILMALKLNTGLESDLGSENIDGGGWYREG